MGIIVSLTWLLSFLPQAPAPELTASDIVSAADYRGGAVAPGEMVLLHPTNAGPQGIGLSHLDNGTIASSAGATRVFFDDVAAPVVYSTRGQVCTVVPYEVANKKVTQVVIEYQGVRSHPVSLPVVDSAPAIFTADQSGRGQAAILNETGCCNSPRNPARLGSVVALYGTGEGQTSPGGADGNVPLSARPADLPAPKLPVKVTVGGVPAEIAFAGGAPHSIAGYEVFGAQNGQQAGVLAKVHPADLLIFDLAMPEPERLIRAAQSEQRQLKIMAMSGASGSGMLRAADMLGAQAVLPKPLVAATVRKRVRELLRVRAKVY